MVRGVISVSIFTKGNPMNNSKDDQISKDRNRHRKRLLLTLSSLMLLATLLVPTSAASARSSTYVAKTTAVCGLQRIDTNKQGLVTLNVIYLFKIEQGGLLPLPLCEKAKNKIWRDLGLASARRLPGTFITHINMQSCWTVGQRVQFEGNICGNMPKATTSSRLDSLRITRVDNHKLLRIGAQPPFIVKDIG